MAWNPFRRRTPEPPVPVESEPVVMTPAGPVAATSLADFTVTVDTAASGGDKLVLSLAREGEPTLHMQVHKDQFMWLIDDPTQFATVYAQREHWVDPYAEPPVEVSA